jgi:hypothetical protein
VCGQFCFRQCLKSSDVVGEIDMIAEPKHEGDNTVRGKRERRRHEKALDEALENTFPASDPVSAEQSVLPAAHTIDASVK